MDRLTRVTLSLLALAAATYLVQAVARFFERFGGFLLLLLMGWVLALILGAVARWLSRPRLPAFLRAGRAPPAADARRQLLPPSAAVLVVYLLLVLGIVGFATALVPVLLPQLQQVIAAASSRGSGIADVTASLQSLADDTGAQVDVHVIFLQQVVPFLRGIAGNLTALVSGMIGFLANLIVVIVVGLYLNLGGPKLAAKAVGIVPARYRDDALLLMRDVPQVFVGFLKGQSLYAALSAAAAALVLAVAGAPWLLLAAVAVFLLSMIPLLGAFLGLIPPVLAALAISPQAAAIVLVVLGAFQLVLTNAVMPRLFSGPLAMEPILVLLSILIGIQVAGTWGGVLGIPVMAMVQVLVGRYYDPETLQEDRLRVGPGSASPDAGHTRDA